VRVAKTDDPTVLVATLKLAVVLPAATVTVAGTIAEALLLDSAREMPPVGAAPVKVTVPVADVPPVTLAGFTTTDKMATGGGVMVRAAVLLRPL